MAYTRVKTNHVVTTINPPIYANIDFDSVRSGSTLRNRVRVSMRTQYGNYAYRSDAWRAVIQIHTASGIGIQVKPVTGTANINGVWYTAQTNYYNFNTNASSIRISVNFYNVNTGASLGAGWAGNVATQGITAPAVPTNLRITPNPATPDKNMIFTWNASSGGTNGVSGYGVQYQVGSGSWVNIGDIGRTTYTLTPRTPNIPSGSQVRFRVRSRTTVNGGQYYSGYATSGYVQVAYVPPSAVPSLDLSSDSPIPTGTVKLSWTTPTTTGSNGIGGYEIIVYLNGEEINRIDVEPTPREYIYNIEDSNAQPTDILAFNIRAYTIGSEIKYYGSQRAFTSNITIITDKYVWVSYNGGEFEKRKLYVIANSETKEIRKENFHIIQ